MDSSVEHAADDQERLLKLYREQLSAYKSVNAELSDLSWTLADLEQQIAGLAADLAAEPNPGLERRLSDLRRWKETMEESVIRHMYRAEELAASIADLRRILQAPPDNDDD